MVQIKKFLNLIILLFFILFQSCENIGNTSIETEKYTPYIMSENVSPLQFNTIMLQISNGVVQLNIDFSLIEILNGNDAKRIEQFKYEILNTNDFKLDFSGNIENITSNSISSNSIQHSGKISITIKESDIGNYLLQIYGTNSETNNSNSIITNFVVRRENNPPVIEQIIAPDTLVVNTSIRFVISVRVSDAQGLTDISRVYFNSYRPDGVSSARNLQMFDDGNQNGPSGDMVANDGTYSLGISINENNMKGSCRFDFYATDRSGARSEVYQHFITIE
jgi:hypothetical protein